MLERGSEQTWESEDYLLHGELFAMYWSLSLWALIIFVIVFVCVCICAAQQGWVVWRVCRSRCLGTQSVPGHTMHHSALHTHRDTFIQSTMLTDWKRRGGVGRWGTKAFGWSKRAGEKFKKVCVRVIWKEIEWFHPFSVVLVASVVCWLLSMSLASVNAGCGLCHVCTY